MQHPLGRDGIRLQEEVVVQRQQRLVDALGLRGLPLGGGHEHLVHLLGRHVGRDADGAIPAIQAELHTRGVVAAVEQEVLSTELSQLRNPGHIARRLLDAHDLGVGRQLGHRLGLEVAGRPARHVVEHDGQLRLRGDVLEVLDAARLRRLDVVGRDDQAGVGAHAAREGRVGVSCSPGTSRGSRSTLPLAPPLRWWPWG
eukprot:scaffold757_cov246-Pinguiococcus_pyrenoidosus.AAC.34